MEIYLDNSATTRCYEGAAKLMYELMTEHYGNTIVVEQVDGVSVWYGNVDVSDVKLYDYVEKGQILGMSRSEDLYLVLMKDGAYLNYQDYVA